MAVEYFNSMGGYSAGIPPVPVIDSNGNVITNVLTTGNVSANVVYATYYKFANGQPMTINAGGSDKQLQYNNGGYFAGIPNVTFDGSILSLGDVTTVRMYGGTNGYVLQTDGEGNLTWTAQTGGGSGNGVPGGANTQVQFNNSGEFAGSSGFTFDSTTGTLNVETIHSGNVTANYFIGNGSQLTGISTGTANYVVQPNQSNITSVGILTSINVSGPAAFSSTTNLGDVSNVTIIGGMNGYVLTTDGTGNLSWSAAGGAGGEPGGSNAQIQFNDNGVFGGSPGMTFSKTTNAVNFTGNVTTRNLTANNTSIYGNANVSGNVSATNFIGNGALLTGILPDTANYVVQPNQSNITSLGTLTSLNVAGNIITNRFVSAANFQTSGAANVGTLKTTGSANIAGTLTANGTINFSNSANITLGDVANIHINGGLNGYFLQTDGMGNLDWAPSGGGGGATSPGGENTQIQYNNNGNFAASPFFTFNNSTNTVQIGGKLIANSMQLGSGSYKFGSSFVYFATTAGVNKTRLYTIPVSDCSGVNFEIIGTDSVGSKRQSVHISSLYYAGIVQYTEYGGVFINGGVGDFSVEYNPGDVITPPSLDLYVVPDTTNSTVYKMWVTVLAP